MFSRSMSMMLQPQKPPIRFVHRRSMDKPQNYTLHLNEYVEIYIFAEGQVDYIIEDGFYSLTRGDVLIISPHDVHVPVLRQECLYERFYLLIPADTFSGLAFDPIANLLKKPRRTRPALTAAEKERILTILYQLSELARAGRTTENSAQTVGLFLQFLGMLTDKIVVDAPLPAGLSDRLPDILRFIHLHAKTIHSVQEVASHFYLSVPYLSSLFKKQVGVSAGDYLRTKKIACAKQLLDDGASVTEAGYACGFSDSSHFIRTFKKFTGITPNQYRHSHQNRE